MVWLYHFGVLPKNIDHINLNRSDNRVCNLRVCSGAENARNRGKTAVNTSGFKGVVFRRDKNAKPWRAQIGHAGRVIYLGAFERPDDAHAAYVAAATKLHGEFARFD